MEPPEAVLEDIKFELKMLVLRSLASTANVVEGSRYFSFKFKGTLGFMRSYELSDLLLSEEEDLMKGLGYMSLF